MVKNILNVELSEMQINTDTAGRQSHPKIAMFPNGNVVAVWQSHNHNGVDWEIRAQILDSNKKKVGPELQVNTDILGKQTHPTIAALNDGGFAIAWQSHTGLAHNICAQIFDEDGAKVGSEFIINTNKVYVQEQPSIGSFEDNTLLAVWQNYGQDGSGRGLFAQRCKSDGEKIGIEFPINVDTYQDQYHPSLGTFKNGQFVVAWQLSTEDGLKNGICVQKFSASGSPLMSVKQILTQGIGAKATPKVGTFDDGSFIVVYKGDNKDGLGWEICEQRFNPNGTPLGSETKVNEYNLGDQEEPTVGTFSDDTCLITWGSAKQDGSGTGIYGRRFNSTNAISPEFLVNIATLYNQHQPYTGTYNDKFHIVWSGYSTTESEIYGRAGQITLLNSDQSILTDSVFVPSSLEQPLTVQDILNFNRSNNSTVLLNDTSDKEDAPVVDVSIPTKVPEVVPSAEPELKQELAKEVPKPEFNPISFENVSFENISKLNSSDNSTVLPKDTSDKEDAPVIDVSIPTKVPEVVPSAEPELKQELAKEVPKPELNPISFENVSFENISKLNSSDNSTVLPNDTSDKEDAPFVDVPIPTKVPEVVPSAEPEPEFKQEPAKMVPEPELKQEPAKEVPRSNSVFPTNETTESADDSEVKVSSKKSTYLHGILVAGTLTLGLVVLSCPMAIAFNFMRSYWNRATKYIFPSDNSGVKPDEDGQTYLGLDPIPPLDPSLMVPPPPWGGSSSSVVFRAPSTLEQEVTDLVQFVSPPPISTRARQDTTTESDSPHVVIMAPSLEPWENPSEAAASTATEQQDFVEEVTDLQTEAGATVTLPEQEGDEAELYDVQQAVGHITTTGVGASPPSDVESPQPQQQQSQPPQPDPPAQEEVEMPAADVQQVGEFAPSREEV